MAVCNNCGAELKNGAKFCENCGAPAEAVQEPVREYVEEQTVEYYTEAPVANTPEQDSMAKSAMIMAIVGLALSELGLPGIIVSAIAKGKVKKATAAGATGGKLKAARILSTIGLILSIVMTIVWLLYIVIIGAAVAYGINEGGFESLESSLNSF